ncbi:four helix bundle protein [Candidatus Kuenenbacteria bacterium]|nr:four helix bundle protein [Candidatus Kuenenbacteria bacterium]
MDYQKKKKEQFKKEFSQRISRAVVQTIKFVDSLPTGTVTKTVKDQLIRSMTSIGANYFEAQAGSSKKDFMNFFSYSLKSANEVKFWLSIVIDCGLGDTQEAKQILIEVNEIANIFASSILTMKGKKKAI